MSYKVRKWQVNDFEPLLDLAECMWQEGAYAHLKFSREQFLQHLLQMISKGTGMCWLADISKHTTRSMIMHLTTYACCD